MSKPGSIATLIKAGRALAGWSQDDLARKAGVSVSGLKKFELGISSSAAMEGKLRAALAVAGVTVTFSEANEGGALTASKVIARRKR